jgi:hypothetical protein
MSLPFWSLSMSRQQHFFFLATPQNGMWSSTTPCSCVFSSIWTTHWITNGSTSRFHFEMSTPSYLFQHALRRDIEGPLCPNFIMFWPKGKHLAYSSIMSQPHFGLSVRVKPTLPKVGSWSPMGLPNTQSSIAGVKYPLIWVFLMSLERAWSVDVQNALALVIWTSAAQVMRKRRAGSQIGSLTPDH